MNIGPDSFIILTLGWKTTF